HKSLFISLSLGLILGFGAARPVAAQGKGDAVYMGKTLKEWTQALQAPNEEGRARAARVLSSLGGEARPAVPALIATLQDKSTVVWQRAAEALGDINPDAKAVVEALAAALKDSELGVRMAAVEGLGKGGAAAQQAVPALSAALKDKELMVRSLA